MSQAAMEVAHRIYVENYLDCVESLPDEIQRHISELRRLDSESFATFNAITTLREGQKKLSESMSPAEAEILERKTLEKIQQLLIRYQHLSDEKLRELDDVGEIIEQKAQQLQQDRLNLDEEKVEKRRSPQPSISRMSQHLLIEKSLIESTPIIPLKSDCVGSSGNASDTLSIDSSNSVGKKQGEKAGPHHRRTKRQRLHDSAASQSPSAPENHVVDCPTPPAATTSRRNGSTKHSSMELDRSSSHSNSVTKEKDHHGGKQKLKPRRKRKASNVGHSGVEKDLPVDPDEPTYCLCDQISYGDMIGCDNPKCELEWFHFSCVGLTAKPKGKWFCPNCRGDKSNSQKVSTSKKS